MLVHQELHQGLALEHAALVNFVAEGFRQDQADEREVLLRPREVGDGKRLIRRDTAAQEQGEPVEHLSRVVGDHNEGRHPDGPSHHVPEGVVVYPFHRPAKLTAKCYAARPTFPIYSPVEVGAVPGQFPALRNPGASATPSPSTSPPSAEQVIPQQTTLHHGGLVNAQFCINIDNLQSISYNSTVRPRILASAYRHGCTTADILHGWQNAIGYFYNDPAHQPGRGLCIGPDAAGRLLEIMFESNERGAPIVFHAMLLRKHIANQLVGRKQR